MSRADNILAWQMAFDDKWISAASDLARQCEENQEYVDAIIDRLRDKGYLPS